MFSGNKNLPLAVAGVVFAIVAIAHLLRIIYNMDVMIATTAIPMSVSYIAFVVALVLSIWMFKARRL